MEIFIGALKNKKIYIHICHEEIIYNSESLWVTADQCRMGQLEKLCGRYYIWISPSDNLNSNNMRLPKEINLCVFKGL